MHGEIMTAIDDAQLRLHGISGENGARQLLMRLLTVIEKVSVQ